METPSGPPTRPETGPAGSVTALAGGAAGLLALSGEYEHRVDGKGRLVLPTAFRPHFAGGGHLGFWQQRCLALFTPEGWDEWLDYNRHQALAIAKPADVTAAVRRARRAADHIVPDGQGRFIVPPRFRELAPLETQVMVLGQGDHVEVWLPDALDAEDAAAGDLTDMNMDAYETRDR